MRQPRKRLCGRGLMPRATRAIVPGSWEWRQSARLCLISNIPYYTRSRLGVFLYWKWQIHIFPILNL